MAKEAFKELLKPAGNRYAVFRCGETGKAMRFTVMHKTEEIACAEAVRLLADSVAQFPDRKHIFTVLELRKGFSYDNGKFSEIDRVKK